MRSRPFAQADPFLQFIVLFLIAFSCVSIFMFGASGFVNLIWGFNFLTDPDAIVDYTNPQMVHINRLLLLFQHIGLFIVPAFIFAQLISNNWKIVLGFRPVRPSFKFIAVGAMILALPGINALAWWNSEMNLPPFLSELEAALAGMEAQAAVLTDALTGSNQVWVLVLNIIIIAFIPALGEELIFRGLLIPILRKWTKNIHWAIWIGAILFSAMHMQFYGFLPRLLLGAFLGYLYVWSGSIWVPILAHFTNNAMALILLFAVKRSALPQEVDSFEPTPVYFGVVIFSTLAFAGVLLMAYRKAVKPIDLQFPALLPPAPTPEN